MPRSINNLGQILAYGWVDPGYGDDPRYKEGEYLLTPSSLGAAEYGVPEPSTLALLGMAAVSSILRRRMHRLHRPPGPPMDSE